MDELIKALTTLGIKVPEGSKLVDLIKILKQNKSILVAHDGVNDAINSTSETPPGEEEEDDEKETPPPAKKEETPPPADAKETPPGAKEEEEKPTGKFPPIQKQTKKETNKDAKTSFGDFSNLD